MKDIWCTFQAGSLNWEKKLLAKSFKKKIIQEQVFTTYDTKADAHATNLQCFDHVCNLLYYLSLPWGSWDFSTFFENVRWNDFGKHGEWTGKTDIIRQNYENLSEKISQLWVLNRGDLNFCTHSMPLQANKQNH